MSLTIDKDSVLVVLILSSSSMIMKLRTSMGTSYMEDQVGRKFMHIVVDMRKGKGLDSLKMETSM